MKVSSINFIKVSEVPVHTRNTENASITSEIQEKLKSLPAGQALSVRIEGAKKYTRWCVRQALAKRGVKVRIMQKDNTFYVVKA